MRECHQKGCDPYTSLLQPKPGCSQNLTKPTIDSWKSDEDFVSQFVHVSNTKCLNDKDYQDQ